jgi:hypothetical protein
MEASGQLYALATLLLGKKTLVPSKHEAGWSLEPVWVFWRREEAFASPQIEYAYHPSHSIVFIVTTPSWFLFV